MVYHYEAINMAIQVYQIEKSISKIDITISQPTLYRYYNKYEYNFKNNLPITDDDINNNKKIHGLNKIHLYEKQVIEYFTNNNVSNKKDIFRDIPNIDLSLSSINKILKLNNFSYKEAKKKFIIKEEDKIDNKRVEYSKNIYEEEFMNSISLDECSFDINDHNNKCYSKKGTVRITNFKHKRRKRMTLLLAVSKSNIVTSEIFEGSLNKKRYIEFLNKNQDKFKNKTIIKDNLPIHKSKEVIELCNNNNTKLNFIPPYSPEVNPIEQFFSSLKSIYRSDHNRENLKETIEKALYNVNKEHLINYYNHSLKYIKNYNFNNSLLNLSNL